MTAGCAATDHLEEFTGCRLLFQRGLQFAIARPHFLKKAAVLNRDCGLVRKGSDELDLTFGERADFAAPNEDHPN